MPHDDRFLREGLQRWGRAQLVVDAFEERLREELTRIAKARVGHLGLKIADTRTATQGRGSGEVSIRVEVHGRIDKRDVEVILGVEWRGDDLRPSYYSGFFGPPELTSLEGCVSPTQAEFGVHIERAEKRDWCVVEVGDRAPDEAFATLLEVLHQRIQKTDR